MGSRGQTETLGFVLVFAIITASIGIVYATGFTGLDDARAVEQTNNAERAFEVFADNIADITQYNAPNRATEIKLAEATLTIADPIEVTVNAGGPLNETYSVRPIIYDGDTGERIVYAQGAIFRESNGNAVVIRESTMLIDDRRTVLPVVRTRLSGTRSIGGSTTVLIRSSHAQTDVIYANDSPPTPIWFNVTSPRAAAWAAHLETKAGVSACTVEDGTAACEIDTDRAHITLVQIDLRLD